MIMLYSTNCPKCKILEKKLLAEGKEFTVISDTDTVLATAETYDIKEAPFIVANDEVYNFTESLTALREGRI